MPLLNRRPAPAYDNTTTPAPRHTLMSRITGRSRRSRPYSNATMAGPATSTTTTHPHHQKRRPSIGDRISGAMLKLRGSLTRRPGKKAAGTRRMRGTDGRGSKKRHPVGTTATGRKRRRFY